MLRRMTFTLPGIALFLFLLLLTPLSSQAASTTTADTPTTSINVPSQLAPFLSVVESHRGVPLAGAAVTSTNANGSSASVTDSMGTYTLAVSALPEPPGSGAAATSASGFLVVNEITPQSDAVWIANANTDQVTSGPETSGPPSVISLQSSGQSSPSPNVRSGVSRPATLEVDTCEVFAYPPTASLSIYGYFVQGESVLSCTEETTYIIALGLQQVGWNLTYDNVGPIDTFSGVTQVDNWSVYADCSLTTVIVPTRLAVLAQVEPADGGTVATGAEFSTPSDIVYNCF